MKKIIAVLIFLASFMSLTMSPAMAGILAVQVYSETSVSHSNYANCQWNWGGGDNVVVPSKKTLSISSATFNYFPAGTGGVVGRADLAGRDASGYAVWRQKIVYVEEYQTVQLTFPQPLLLEEGGWVEVGFVNDGPGNISVSLQGYLIDK